MRHEAPKLSFRVSWLMNQFCHMSVLCPEVLHPELSTGMLANLEYRRQNAQRTRPEVTERLGHAGVISPGLWYSFARVLMNADSLEDVHPFQGVESSTVELLVNLLGEGREDYDEVWETVEPRLKEYTEKFATEWSPVGDRVLSKLSKLVDRDWDSEKITVCFVECLQGGFGWVDSIGLTPVPEMDVGKKLLTHELSELITPQKVVAQSLRRADLKVDDPEYQHGLIHTIVDMVAYFSVREFLDNPERKGMKPNPRYYQYAEAIYPMFEDYSLDPTKYNGFDGLIHNMALALKGRSLVSSVAS